MIHLSDLQKSIWRILKIKGTMHRDQICKELGLKNNERRTTVFNNLEKLEKKGLVRRWSEEKDTPGRPYIYWEVSNDE